MKFIFRVAARISHQKATSARASVRIVTVSDNLRQIVEAEVRDCSFQRDAYAHSTLLLNDLALPRKVVGTLEAPRIHQVHTGVFDPSITVIPHRMVFSEQ
jgi:hypothetical protein